MNYVTSKRVTAKKRPMNALTRTYSLALDWPTLQRKKIVDYKHENVVNEKDDERMYLYLPRNLSFCQTCADALTQHLRHKVKLLAKILPLINDAATTSSRHETNGKKDSDEQDTSDVIVPVLKSRKGGKSEDGKKSSRPPSKVVRFADSLGLELENIQCHIKSRFLTLHLPADANYHVTSAVCLELYPAFDMPCSLPDFYQKLYRQNVCLKSINISEKTVYGVASVINLTFHKTILVRYSVNNWKTFLDVHANYIQGSSHDNVDEFSFTFYVHLEDVRGGEHKIYFAVCYKTQDGRDFWDNNEGMNYILKCSPRIKSVPKCQSWLHFL